MWFTILSHFYTLNCSGFAVGKGELVKTAIRKVLLKIGMALLKKQPLTINFQAKNRAINYLQFVPRYKDHTSKLFS